VPDWANPSIPLRFLNETTSPLTRKSDLTPDKSRIIGQVPSTIAPGAAQIGSRLLQDFTQVP
jgi:hypothetical protein